MRHLILASGSPRRRELLGYMGVSFAVCAADVDEHMDGDPETIVKTLASRKARYAASLHPNEVVLAADTLVYCQGQVLGKPADECDALRMLALLSGNTHAVYTGVCLMDGKGGEDVRCEVSQVTFVPFDRAAARRYLQSGESMDKAGAYAVQGMGGMFIARVAGSPSNVKGLPMHVVRDMLLAIGWEV